jgi:tRNA threonylcarbamoyladenosine biosynthesis protein TsaE
MKLQRIKDLDALDAFARAFAADLRPGDVVGLVGDLGAGKTTFVQRLAAHLGVHEAVKSPTFILMQVFETGPGAAPEGVARLCHVDAYRLKDEKELDAIGFADYAGASGTVTVVEWADRVPGIHAYPQYRELTFGFGKGEERLLSTGK